MTIVAPAFGSLVRLLGVSEGVDNLAVVQYPGAWLTDTKAEMAEKLQENVFGEIVTALTERKESSISTSVSGRRPKGNEGDVVFRGSLEEVNRFFSQQEWSDQLPVIPPSSEKVKEFLKYTDFPPDKVVAVLPAANLKATVWKIAVNGVMAGCRPEHMPVLIAGVEAISVPSYNLGQIGTTWALSPYFLISGPIVKQLGIEHGIGLNSRGPNPALGRAFGLIIRNLAGFKPGEMAMGTWGYVPPFFLAEDEGFLSQIGWKPYHVEQGLEENTSAVTAGATWSWGDQMTMSMVGEGFTRATELLDAMAFDLTRKVVPTLSLRGGPRGFGMATVLLSLPSARFIAAEGYSRQDVVDYLYERTKRTVAEWAEWWVKAGAKPDVPLTRLEQYVREGTVSREVLDKPGEKIVPIVAHARQQLKVFVCGDDSKEKTMAMYGWYITPSTRKIELPAAWERLLNEAKERGGMQQAVLAR